MVKINRQLFNLNSRYSFFNVSKTVEAYRRGNPDKRVISLGIGDVSRPIVRPVIEAMHEAVEDLSDMKTFRGYGASSGYDFLKEKILEEEYGGRFTADEIYISNGAKTDVSNILELFDRGASIYVSDPLYPIYKDGAYCLGRDITFGEVDGDFVPVIPQEKYDVIYLCSPNNPTGACYKAEELRKWVDYALENDSVILYDNVYAAFISSDDCVRSVYEIPGAERCAVEFRSFSKNASFTGVRCSYYVIPDGLYEGINDIWKLRTINRFNGADYIAQRGALASYLDESKKLIGENIAYYRENARILISAFESYGFDVSGGKDSPYLWIRTGGMTSMEFFDMYLRQLNIVIVPGIIFGPKGDGYFRVSALARREVIEEAIERLNGYYKKEK